MALMNSQLTQILTAFGEHEASSFLRVIQK
jgi:hypothetical protein